MPSTVPFTCWRGGLQGVHITLPFILASYMVRDFSRQGKVQATDEQTLGRLIGFLGAAHCGTQFTTGYPIGRLSDYIGRKASSGGLIAPGAWDSSVGVECRSFPPAVHLNLNL